MPGNAQQKPTNSLEPSGAIVHRIRSDHGDYASSQTAVLESISASLLIMASAMASENQVKPQTMTYDEAAIAVGVAKSTLEKMVSKKKFREGRHYIRVGAGKDKDRMAVLFHRNLVDLIFEDQLSVEDDDHENTKPEKVKKSRTKSSHTSTGSNFSAFNQNYS